MTTDPAPLEHKPRVLGDMPEGLQTFCGYAGGTPGGCLAPATWHGLVLNAARNELATSLTACDTHKPQMSASADYLHARVSTCGSGGAIWWNAANDTSGCIGPTNSLALHLRAETAPQISDDAIHAQAAAYIRGHAAGLDYHDLAELVFDDSVIGGICVADLDKPAIEDMQRRLLEASHSATVIVGWRNAGDTFAGMPAGRVQAWVEGIRRPPADFHTRMPLALVGDLAATLDEYSFLVDHVMECPALAVADPYALPACRVCGCTDAKACAGGCSWVPDPWQNDALCSACLPTDPAAIPKAISDVARHIQAFLDARPRLEPGEPSANILTVPDPEPARGRWLHLTDDHLRALLADLALVRAENKHLAAANIQLQDVAVQASRLIDAVDDSVPTLLADGAYQGPPISQELADALNGPRTVILPARAADPAPPAHCGNCWRAFDPADFDGAAEDRTLNGFCRGCVDNCHEGGVGHRCAVCKSLDARTRTVGGRVVDEESYQAWAEEGRASAGIDHDDERVDSEGDPV